MKDKIKALLIVRQQNEHFELGYANGYVGVPKGHPWYGCDYIYDNPVSNISIHGGITWADDKLPEAIIIVDPSYDNLWWVGFDTAHGGDSMIECDKTYCLKELDDLKQQAIKACEGM